MSLKDDRVLYSRNGDKLFTPASNMKIYTTAIALDLLGAEYRWRTSVYAATQPNAEGVIDGDVVLYGRGAPDLDSKKAESLPALADQMQRRGVRQVGLLGLLGLLGAVPALLGNLVVPALARVRHKADYRNYGGGPLLGVKGVAIIAHGKSDAAAIFSAIRQAHEAVERGAVTGIAEVIAPERTLARGGE